MKPGYFIFIMTSLLMVNCQVQDGKEAKEGNLGELQHQFVIDAPARASFDKGLLLLHSFEYEDAREAFIEAREAAPDELMAHWGEAMTHYRALWGLQDVEAGREVLARVGDTEEERLARAGDDLERGFWKGVEILYGEGEFHERNKAYAEHMALLYADFEQNQEVAAFYALGLMWSNTLSREDELYNLSASVAEGILEENPNHPGALHYVIHAYDDPDYAKRAEEAADKYSKVAPDATHALHMPSHIYVAMGLWNEVVASNETSYAASVSRMERKGLGDEARGYHSYAWLHYGYLQQKRFDDAAKLLEDMYAFNERAGSNASKSYLIMMQNHYLVETGKVNGIKGERINYNNLGLGSKAGIHFLNAMLAMEAGDAAAIDLELDTLETHIAAAELIVTDEGVALCSAGPTRYAPTRESIIAAQVLAEQMKAMIAALENDVQAEEAHLKQSVAYQDELGPPVGPPNIYSPSYERYGQWLLEQGRMEEALEQFETTLRKMPNRRVSLESKEKILRALDRTEEADEVAELLATFTVQPTVS